MPWRTSPNNLLYSPSNTPTIRATIDSKASMDPSDNTSSTQRFRFRDHRQQIGNGDTFDGNTSSDTCSISSDGDAESELETMTGKGIQHLCSELLELKKASDEDFQKNIFSNYSAFLRVFEELEGIEDELLLLKDHISTQKRLVKNLTDDIYAKILFDETVDSAKSPDEFEEPPSPSIFETHANDIAEILDTLILEHRLDEAIVILEMEDATFQSMELQENLPPDVWISYNSTMSDKKSMLTDRLTMVAENPRVPAAELQVALAGLCRLGDSHLATKLLLNYYHTRIKSGVIDSQFSKTFVQIREVAKFVFSMISQAAKGFIALHGETSPYASELIDWAYEETKVFAKCFITYIKSISDISGGLSIVVEAVHVAMTYCALLEKQSIFLQPCLLKNIRTCIEDVLFTHFVHIKKVIIIFTSSDVWVLGRYHISGISSEENPSIEIDQQPEYYCFLTNSGRKFLTLLQGITEDISSLVSFQMKGSIFEGLSNLFTEYMDMLERGLTNKPNDAENICSKINTAVSLEQQVSILMNLSVIARFFSGIIRNVFKNVEQLKFEIDSYILFIQESCSRHRSLFCKQFIQNISFETNRKNYGNREAASKISISGMLPSVPYQGLFLELKKLEKLGEDNIIESNWLTGLLTELMEAIFVSIASDDKFFTVHAEDSSFKHSSDFMQFILDIQFLVEIAKCGGYLTDSMVNMCVDIISRMESAFVSVGLLDPNRDENEYGWAITAANEAFQKLQEIEHADNEEQSEKNQTQFENDDDDAVTSSKYTVELPEDIQNRALKVNIKAEDISEIEIRLEEGQGLTADNLAHVKDNEDQKVQIVELTNTVLLESIKDS